MLKTLSHFVFSPLFAVLGAIAAAITIWAYFNTVEISPPPNGLYAQLTEPREGDLFQTKWAIKFANESSQRITIYHFCSSVTFGKLPQDNEEAIKFLVDKCYERTKETIHFEIEPWSVRKIEITAPTEFEFFAPSLTYANFFYYQGDGRSRFYWTQAICISSSDLALDKECKVALRKEAFPLGRDIKRVAKAP